MAIPTTTEIKDIVVRDTRETLPNPAGPNFEDIPNPNYNKLIVEYKTTVGPLAPLVVTSQGIQSSYSDNIMQTVREHWKMILFTNKGESISDPDFGCGLMTFLFQNMSGEVSKQYISTDSLGQQQIFDTNYKIPMQEIRMIITQQVRKYMDYLTLTGIEVNAGEDTNSLKIKIAYRLDITGEQDILEYEISDVYAGNFIDGSVVASDIIGQYQ